MKHSAKNRQESIRHTESIQNYNKIMIINNFKNYKLMASRSKNASTQAHTHTHTRTVFLTDGWTTQKNIASSIPSPCTG